MQSNLANPKIKPQYTAIRNPKNWTEKTPTGELKTAQALIAAYVGKVRLIDTLRLDEDV